MSLPCQWDKLSKEPNQKWSFNLPGGPFIEMVITCTVCVLTLLKKFIVVLRFFLKYMFNTHLLVSFCTIEVLK